MAEPSEYEPCHICNLRDAVTQDGVCMDCDDRHPKSSLSGTTRTFSILTITRELADANAEIERLREEMLAIAHDRDMWIVGYNRLHDSVDAAKKGATVDARDTEIERLRAALAAARYALEPWGRVEDSIPESGPIALAYDRACAWLVFYGNTEGENNKE